MCSLLLALMFILLIISSAFVRSKGFNNYTTESNTLFLKENECFDILFMGISHARNFSRHKNHLRVENILKSKVVNLGQGSGACGVNEQLFYLDYFFYRGNTVSKIIYVLSPPMLFSPTLPIASNTFKYEMFEIPFLFRYLQFKSENKNARIIYYLQSKLHPRWLFRKPYTKESMNKQLDSLNIDVVMNGQNVAYGGTNLNLIQFNKSIKIVEETIKLAKNNNSEVILLIPPALFGKWRGHQETICFAELMKDKYSNVKIIDGSETILNPEYYYDNHHLNTDGIVLFTKNYLLPMLK